MARLSHRIPTTVWRAPSTWAVRPVTWLPLLLGLSLFGLGEGLLVRSDWGATPWTVFAQGIARHAHVPIGWSTIAISAAVLLLWWPLRERPGLGTVTNLIVIAGVLDVTATNVPVPASQVGRGLFVALAVAAIGAGSALYLTTGLGPGPRDGLMTSLHRRLGVSVVYVRLSLEATVLVIGWLLGGTVGVGTAVFASTIGFAIGAGLRGAEWVSQRMAR